MLKPKKKLTKRELKEDPLVTKLGQAEMYYETNKKYINYGLFAMVAIIVIVMVYVNNHRKDEEKAATELGKIFMIFDAAATDKAQYTIAINGQPERGIMGLKTIVDNYGSTGSGQKARLYLGDAYYNLGQYDDAMRQFDNFSGSDPLLSASALAGVAACYEAKHNYGDAAAKYEKASSVVAIPDAAAEYLNLAAIDYGTAGQKEKAVTLLKKLKKEYPTTSYARDADRYITEFSL
ncbi:MAG TPA: tetratricopeptide repeat protein [Bacteroidota bacterium]|nr:tetratricopeptide repeat protein [Bacteroidota bacterium]